MKKYSKVVIKIPKDLDSKMKATFDIKPKDN